jgi:hypothetical protein
MEQVTLPLLLVAARWLAAAGWYPAYAWLAHTLTLLLITYIYAFVMSACVRACAYVLMYGHTFAHARMQVTTWAWFIRLSVRRLATVPPSSALTVTSLSTGTITTPWVVRTLYLETSPA